MQQNMRPITKPDLNSVFESMLPLAKTNPQYINAYLLTGTPEQKLVAAMIKDMPQGQPQAAPAQAPTQTVIDQKIAQVDPGIASLPVAEGMFDGGSYAGGGIVAFDDGGNVPSYAGPRGSYVVGPDPNELMQSYNNRLAGEEQRYASDRPEYGLSQITAYAQHKNALAKLEQATKTPYDAAIQYYDSIGNLQGKMMAQEKRADWLENPTNLMENAVSATPAKPLAAQPVIDPNKKAAMVEPAAAAPTDAQLLGQRQPQNITNQMAPTIGSKVSNNFGLSSIDPNKYLPKKETMTDIEKEQADAYARAGVTDKPYEAGLQSILDRREKLAKSEEQAPWMALAKAGFATAAGKSQFGLQNLAEGAGAGLADLTAAKDKLETRRDQLEDKEQAYNLAQNQYMQNRTDANLSRVRSSKDNFEKAQQGLEVANNNIQNEGKKLALNVELEKIKLDASNFNAAQTRQLQRLQIEKPDAFSVMLDAVNSDTTLKTKMQRAEKLVEMTKKATAGSLKGLEDSATVVTAANENAEAYLSKGPGKKLLLEAQAKGPAAEKAFRDKVFNENFARLARTTPVAPAPTAGVKFLGYEE
jgi:hypothetical protein